MADKVIQMQVRNEANTAWDNIYPITKDNVPYAIATGGTNVYAATITPAPSSYIDGMAVAVKIPVDSTGASTINVNGLGAKGIKKANGSDVTNLKAGGIYTLRYNGVNFILQGEGASGNATASDLLSGKTATTDAGEIIGTIPSKGAATITPGTMNQTIAAGRYLSGAQTIKGDANLVSSNIKRGVTMFGVTGNANILQPGTNIVASNDTEKSIGGAGIYYKYKEIQVSLAATYRVYFSMKSDSPSTTMYARIYINGSAVGTIRTLTSANYVEYVEDIAVPANGLVQIYLKENSGYTCHVRNFRLGLALGTFTNNVV